MINRRVTREEVKDPERLFKLLSDLATDLTALSSQVNKPAPPLPKTEKSDSVLTGAMSASAAQVRLGITEIGTRRHNLNGLGAPTTDDDNSKGYDVGSVWINVLAGPPKTIFMLAAATTTAAEWVQIG